MKTDVECLSCFMRQALRTVRLSQMNSEQEFQIFQKISTLISTMRQDISPVANARPFYDRIAELTGNTDPYAEIKQESNVRATEHLARLMDEMEKTADPLSLAVRYAIAGNIIDYGGKDVFDIAGFMESCRTQELVIDDIARLRNRIEMLSPGSRVLYLVDNCGEIVYDGLLVEILWKHGFDLTVAVKDGPIINDALTADALFAGLDRYAAIITNGTRCPGTVLEECSEEFAETFREADLVISKGQGNYESLSEEQREIFFLLTVKCSVAAQHLRNTANRDTFRLEGRGEMVVYCSEDRR